MRKSPLLSTHVQIVVSGGHAKLSGTLTVVTNVSHSIHIMNSGRQESAVY